MTVGKELRTIASRSYYANLDEKMKKASDFLFDKIVERAQEGKFHFKVSYTDKDIPSDVLKLLEDSDFYTYIKSENMNEYYDPEKGEYSIYWEEA
jgi:hypothetical protein